MTLITGIIALFHLDSTDLVLCLSKGNSGHKWISKTELNPEYILLKRKEKKHRCNLYRHRNRFEYRKGIEFFDT